MSGRPWTKADLRTLKRRYPHEPTADIARDLGRSESSTYQAAITRGWRKSAKYLASAAAKRFDGKRGPRFEKGHKPWNSGKKGWKAGGRAVETQFKLGNMPQTWRPIGSERIEKDGILYRKVADTRRKSDWKAVHVLIWEEHNGPIPKGHIVIFRDRNQQNRLVENLDCITRAELMDRNRYQRYPKDVARLIQLRGALNRQINRRERNEKPNRRSA